MPPVKTFGERIADALVEDGLLTAAQVEELLEQQKKEGTRLLKLVLEKAYVSEQDMAVSHGPGAQHAADQPRRASPSRRKWPTWCPRDMATQSQGRARLAPGEQALPGHGRSRSTCWPWTTSSASPSWKSPR